MARWRFAAGIAFALMLSGAHAADFARIGPDAPATALIMARGVIQEPALEFVYKIEGAQPRTITVDLAQDFSVAQEGNTLVIRDFALRRVITLDDPSHSFENTSLYGLVDSLYAETYNRRFERALLSQAKAANSVAMLSPFWVQSQLHVMSPEDGTPHIDRRADADHSVHFSYAGGEVASYMPSDHALTTDEGARFAKFLRYNAAIHPTIIDDIVAGGKLPQRLSFESVLLDKPETIVWTLQSVTPVKAAYPLQMGAKALPPKFEGATKIVGELAPIMQAARAGQASGRRSVEDYRAAMEGALTEGKPFQAVVTALEFTEQYGQRAADCASQQKCHSLKEIFAAAGSDPRTPALLAALADSIPQKADALKALQAMKRDDLNNPYVLDDFLANDLVAAGRTVEALPLFANAIKGNPYLGGYYKDLGDLFRVSFEPDLAWFCYDLGRALPGGPNAPVISDMNGYEAALEKKYPQFF